MSSPGLLIGCVDPTSPHWTSLPACRPSVLLGWRDEDGDRHGGGISPDVARIVSHALARVGTVTFLAESGTLPACSDYEMRTLEPSSWSEWLRLAVWRSPPGISLVSTRVPEVIARLFEDVTFPWWLQAQLVFVGDGDSRPPRLDRETVVALLGSRRPIDWGPLARAGIRAVVRPGVDGALAVVQCDSGSFETRMLRAFAYTARGCGLDWRLCSEEAFARGLAGTPPAASAPATAAAR